jgi:hypothetical protein
VIAACAAVLVVVIVLVAVLGLGHAPTGPIVGNPLDSAAALSAGQAAGSQAQDGPWHPDTILGVSTTQSSASAAQAGEYESLGCSTVWVNSSNSVVPATPGSAAPGVVSWWLIFSNDSQGYLLITLVTNLSGVPAASNLVILSGGCTSTFTAVGTIPSPVIGSEAATSTADGDGGSVFLAEHAGATRELAIEGPLWYVGYTTCSFYGGSGSGIQFQIGLYAQNGTVEESATTTTGPCP